MFFRTIYDPYLAHYSYMVGCEEKGEVCVIDPARNIQPYLEIAKEKRLRIVSAFETHIHADYVSGLKVLGCEHNVQLYVSKLGKYGYVNECSVNEVGEEDCFTIGNISFHVIHTPGHTPEHISLLVKEKGEFGEFTVGIFTGDFLFVGDVGRPDLLEKALHEAGTAEEGAKQIFQSLQKCRVFDEYIQVWPTHGAGSVCGKSLGSMPSSTIGYELRANWAFQVDEERTFIGEVLKNQPEVPYYFAKMKEVNKKGPRKEITEIPPILRKLPILEEHDKLMVIDTRETGAYRSSHIPGTINIPFNFSFATWAGWLLEYDKDIIIIAEKKDQAAVQGTLASIGFDRVVAFVSPHDLLETAEKWEHYDFVVPSQVSQLQDDKNVVIIDVRNEVEWNDGHIEGAKHVMLGTLLRHDKSEWDANKMYITYCKRGPRSSIAASVLQYAGFKNVKVLEGGYEAWSQYKKG